MMVNDNGLTYEEIAAKALFEYQYGGTKLEMVERVVIQGINATLAKMAIEAIDRVYDQCKNCGV